MDQSSDKAIIVLVRGLPGSGKSYVVNRLAELMGQDQAVWLDPDLVDTDSEQYSNHVKQLTSDGVDEKLHLYRFLRGQAYRAIADRKLVVWNQPFTNMEIFNKMVANFYLQAKENSVDLKVLVVEVNINPEIAHDRVKVRKADGGHGPSVNTYERFVNDYATAADDGYNVISVDGSDDVDKSASTIVEAIKGLR